MPITIEVTTSPYTLTSLFQETIIVMDNAGAVILNLPASSSWITGIKCKVIDKHGNGLTVNCDAGDTILWPYESSTGTAFAESTAIAGAWVEITKIAATELHAESDGSWGLT